ncbi:MAG: hypothetical protein Q4A98_00545 [Comamonadaceae bacterium]|nr:hypothetical protein [Comamonadaceae bacterium]
MSKHVLNDKHVLLAGLTDHEAAAIEIMIGMTWRDNKCVVLKRDLTMSAPVQTPQALACRYCVVDLFSLGMRKHTPETQVRLLEFLDGRSAVLLFRGSTSGWQEAKLPLQEGQHLAWLAMPYTSMGLRDALKSIRADAPAAEVSEPPAPAPAPAVIHSGPGSLTRSLLKGASAPDIPAAPAEVSEAQKEADEQAKMPAWRRALLMVGRKPAEETPASSSPAPAPAPAVAVPQKPEPAAPARQTGELPGTGKKAEATRQPQAPLSVAPPVVRLSLEARGINQDVLERLQAVFPALRQMALVRFIGKLLGGAYLLRVGPSIFVLDSQAGWIVSLSSVSSIRKMVQTPGVLEAMEMQPLLSIVAEDVARQHFGKSNARNRKPLDVLVWELVSDALLDVRLQAKENLSFQLRRFPNFSQIEQIGPLDVQLAAICARMPQSIEDLVRAFPKNEQDVLRFIVLSVISGLAAVVPMPAQAPVAQQPVSVGGREKAAIRRGFFKSLLDKLF